MKKLTVFLLAACLLLSGCGAISQEAAQPVEAVFTVDGYGLQLTADSSFYEDTGGSFDLQITNDHAFVSIMAYKYIDLPQDCTPADVYVMQNQDIFSRRTNVTALEEAETKGLYSAERDGVKNYYATYLIDLPEQETFAWVLVTAAPSYLENNRAYLDGIVASITTAE